jgi:hypothetical protein
MSSLLVYAVREFILLLVVLIGGALVLAIVMLTLPVIAFALLLAERRGHLRLGGFYRDHEPG